MGRSLTELWRTLVVLAVLGLLVVSAVPRFGGGERPDAIENAVVANLEQLVGAETRAVERQVRDRDGDGLGEYLGLADLARAVLMSATWGRVGPDGVLDHIGYRIRLWLPGPEGGWVGADRRLAPVDPDRAEREWRVYAWPKVRGERTARVFFADQSGRILASSGGAFRWEGLREPPVDAVHHGGDWVVVRE